MLEPRSDISYQRTLISQTNGCAQRNGLAHCPQQTSHSKTFRSSRLKRSDGRVCHARLAFCTRVLRLELTAKKQAVPKAGKTGIELCHHAIKPRELASC